MILALTPLLLGSVLAAPPGLRAATATSGRADAALDGDLSTGWQPGGEPVGEGWVLEFEDPVPLTRLRLDACPGRAPFEVAVWFDGVGAARSLSVQPGYPRLVVHSASRPVQRVEVRVVEAAAEVCLAEVEARGPDGPYALVSPRGVAGRLAASSIQEPATAWSPRRAFDGRLDTAWGSGGGGPTESLMLNLEEPLDLVGVELWVGDRRDPGPQFPPALPTSVRLTTDDGPPVVFPLAPGADSVLLPLARRTAALTVEVVEVEGSAPTRGAAVAEVRLWTVDGAVALELPEARPPGRVPLPDRVLRPVCTPDPGLPSAVRLRPDGSAHLSWQGEDATGSYWVVLEGTWAPPEIDGASWTARIDGTLRTWRTAASGEPVGFGPGPTLGGSLSVVQAADLGDGLVTAGTPEAGCPTVGPESGEWIVTWNDAIQRMR